MRDAKFHLIDAVLGVLLAAMLLAAVFVAIPS
jgi:hypothetical protein